MTSEDYKTQVSTFLHSVSTPGQYVGGEWNSAKKDNWSELLKIALAFPDAYSVGMSHHGLKILYEILNKEDYIAAERVFTPLPDMEKELRERSLPLFTLENAIPLHECDVVGFSLQYEMCASNLFTMLDLGGIAINSADRNDCDPLVIAGGAGAFNPEPFADFVDLFLIGEGEEAILEFAALYNNLKNENLPCKKLLQKIVSSLRGWYAPALYKKEGTKYVPACSDVPEIVERRFIADFESSPQVLKPVVPIVQTAHERVTLEIMRGCPNGCRFCHAGMTTRPLRARSVESLCRAAEEGYKNTGYDEIGLLSLSSSDYPDFPELVEKLDSIFAQKKVNLSLPSLRVDSALSAIPEKVKSVRKGGFTIAPEAGTDRLRRVINKDVTNENLMQGVENIFKAGWRSVKLYFMQGLPTEIEEDIEAIALLANQAAKLKVKKGGGPAITLSVSNFVPKAHTPYQWFGMNSIEELTAKQQIISRLVNRKSVSYKSHDINTSLFEGMIARGDRNIGRIMFDAWKNGARFCAWSEYFNNAAWQKSFSDNNFNPVDVACREIAIDEDLAWSHISAGVSNEFLKREWQKSISEDITAKCGPGCGGCGVETCGLRGASK
ncbi:MAG: TIGR03960 family B12-binding radical SAM protein [Planctomycetota bacterium]|jgi:radical SAM family uncharacterized protein